jgi:SIT family siderophore-iron:H+ symporter-like MFS transporter
MESRGITNATALADSAYADPFTFVATYTSGTVERDALNSAYREVQRYLCITGICLAVVLFAFSLGLKDTHLGDKQSNDDAEEETKTEKEKAEVEASR